MMMVPRKQKDKVLTAESHMVKGDPHSFWMPQQSLLSIEHSVPRSSATPDKFCKC